MKCGKYNPQTTENEMAKRTRNEKPEVKVKITSFEHPDAVRIEILISGADQQSRKKVQKAFLLAIKNVTG